tara:strand:+ start:422 stop:1162 length:741 start_codon:yes stop_codon:yes gene_type:complete
MANKLRKIKYYIKIFFGVSTIVLITFGIGTFYPNPFATKDLVNSIETKHTIWAKDLGLYPPDFHYKTSKEFIRELNYCVDYLNFQTPVHDRVPIDMLVGQAVLESAWGMSRFAKEANNLFGIRVFDKKHPHLLPEGLTKWPGWGVRVFPTKCDSVKEYIRLLNEHPAYEDFRKMRIKMIKNGEKLDATKLIKTLKAFSTTEDYATRVIKIISKVHKVQSENEVEQKDEVVTDENKILPKTKPENNS